MQSVIERIRKWHRKRAEQRRSPAHKLHTVRCPAITRRLLSSAKGICDSCRLACVPARAIIPKDLNPEVPKYLFENYDLMVVASGPPSCVVGPKELFATSLVRFG